jgi:hypothetical protein
MSAADVLQAARAAGVVIDVDGDDLVLEASVQPPDDVLEALSSHKAEIVALLRPDSSQTSWRVLYEERAAHWSLGGRRAPAEAESLAWGELQVRWHA